MARSDDNTANHGPLVAGVNTTTGPWATATKPVRTSTARSASCGSLVLALLWIGGLGSVFAVGLGALGASKRDAGRAFRLVGVVGALLGLFGIVIAFYLVFRGVPSQAGLRPNG